MPDSQRHADSSPPPTNPLWSTWAFVLVGLALLIVAVGICYRPAGIGDDALRSGDQTFAALPLWMVVLTATTVLGSLLCLLIASFRMAALGAVAPRLDAIHERLTELATLLDSVNERLLVSDLAKRIAYRGKDRQVLRDAIRHDLSKGDFDAAMVMVNQMSETYGYREEAEEFRQQIMDARNADVNASVNKAIARVDDLTAREQWEQAFAEVGRIQRMYPDTPRCANLPDRVRQAYENRKHELEREFLRAAERDDVDGAMELLHALDRYLTEQEAAPFRETARGVIGKKRDNLGVQFKLAVHDKEWTRGLEVGHQIIRDFPNTKMADEVRAMLDMLRQRAADEQAASPSPLTR